MGYKLTHATHVLRKTFKGSEKGSFKKMIVSMAVALGCSLLWRTPIGGTTDVWLQTTLNTIRGDRLPPPNVVIVSLDDKSYSDLGLSLRQPFPREIFSKALERIHLDKPKVVILDLVAVPDRENPVANELLRDAMSSGPTVASIIKSSNPFRSEEKGSGAFIEHHSDSYFSDALAMEVPLATQTFFGTATRISHSLESGDAHAQTPILLPLRKFVDNEIVAPGGRDLINYYGSAGSIRRISIADVVNGSAKAPEGIFFGKVILMGYQSIGRNRGFGDKEQFAVPLLGEEMFGVEIQATVAANLLDGTWIRRMEIEVERFLITILAFFLMLGMLSTTSLRALVYLGCYTVVWFALTYILFSNYYYFLPGIYHILAGGLVILTVTAVVKNLTDRAELRDMRKMVYGGDGSGNTMISTRDK